jgi:hypothetical protein
VDIGEGSYEFNILINMDKKDCKLIIPFKIDPLWMEAEYFQGLVKKEWVKYGYESKELAIF